jgi:hypothetical protein
MVEPSKSSVLGFVLALTVLSPLHAQTVSRAPMTSAAAAKTTASSPAAIVTEAYKIHAP